LIWTANTWTGKIDIGFSSIKNYSILLARGKKYLVRLTGLSATQVGLEFNWYESVAD